MENGHVQCSYCPRKGTLFIKHSKAPVTILAVKDRVLANNPLGALCTARSFYTRLNTGRPRRQEGKDAG